ncbi:unnamed protein product, partial [Staurois parvus]
WVQETEPVLDRLPSQPSPRHYFLPPGSTEKADGLPPVFPDRPLLALPHCTVGAEPTACDTSLGEGTTQGQGQVDRNTRDFQWARSRGPCQLTVVSDVPTDRWL